MSFFGSREARREFLISLGLPPLPLFISLCILGRGVWAMPQEPYLTTGTTLLILTGVATLGLSIFWWRSKRKRAHGLLLSLTFGSVVIGLLALAFLNAMKGAITG